MIDGMATKEYMPQNNVPSMAGDHTNRRYNGLSGYSILRLCKNIPAFILQHKHVTKKFGMKHLSVFNDAILIIPAFYCQQPHFVACNGHFERCLPPGLIAPLHFWMIAMHDQHGHVIIRHAWN